MVLHHHPTAYVQQGSRATDLILNISARDGGQEEHSEKSFVFNRIQFKRQILSSSLPQKS